MTALLAWLWQGLAVAAAMAAALRLCRAPNAATRYLIWWGTLATILVLPLASSFRSMVPSGAAAAGSAVMTPTILPAIHGLVLPAAPAWSGSLLATLWLLFSAVSLARVAGALLSLIKARRSCRSVPAALESMLPDWQSLRNQGRRVRLGVTDHVGTASVLGLGRPVIALPPTVLDRFGPAELDHIVVHELAHVRRGDDWAALGQALVRAFFGWHPAVWLIDRRLDLEREAACDDWVVSCGRSPFGYARCLTLLAGGHPARPGLALTPHASRSKAELSVRVERLLDGGRGTCRTRHSSRSVVLTALASLAAATVVLSSIGPMVATASQGPSSARPLVDLQTELDGTRPATLVARADSSAGVDAGGRLSSPDGKERSSRPAATGRLLPDQPRRATLAAPALGTSNGADLSPASSASPEDGTDIERLTARAISGFAELPARPATAVTRGDDVVAPASAVPDTVLPEARAAVRRPWSDAARAGGALGTAFRRMGGATGGFFSRVASSITHTF